MKKVLVIVCNNFTHDKRVINISNSLQKNEYNVDILAEKQCRGLKLKENKGYIVHRVPLFSSLYSKQTNTVKSISHRKIICSKMKKIIKNNKTRMLITSFLNWFTFNFGVFFKGLIIKPDIVYANDLDTLTVGFLLSRILKTKLIFDSHELWLMGNKFNNCSKIRQKMWVIIEKRLIHKADCVICTTDLRSEYLKKEYGLQKVTTIHNYPKYSSIQNNNFFRNEFRIAQDHVILLYQGLLDEKRGIFNIVNSCSKIDKISIIFMGMGRDREKLREYIISNKLDKKMFVKKAVEPKKLLEYTSSADIGLQLLYNTDYNHYSTISNKLMEYFMAGIAIIASDFPEIRKVVTENQIGILVDPENENQIEQAVRKLINDSRLLEKYKANSVANRYKYTWENEEKKLLAIFENFKKASK